MMNIAGIVLAGGRSSRFGKPKMFESYKGIPFYQHSVNALLSAIPKVYIVTNKQLAPFFNSSSVSILIEENEHNGPLHALSYAFESIQTADWFFLLAADIPFVTKEFVLTLSEQITDSDIDAIVPVSGDKEQPLLALYHRRCLPHAKQILASNKRSMKPLFQSVNVKWIPFPDTQKDFTNINTQEQWEIEQR
jgi:molybdopterin-guanine dinucleotide biosynthesis protein A